MACIIKTHSVHVSGPSLVMPPQRNDTYAGGGWGVGVRGIVLGVRTPFLGPPNFSASRDVYIITKYNENYMATCGERRI